MPALQQELIAEYGDSFFARFTVEKPVGTPLSLAGIQADLQIRTLNSGIPATVVATWSTTSGEITTNASGEIEIKVDAAQVQADIPLTASEYVLHLIDYDPDDEVASVGDNFRVAQGALLLRA